MSAPKLKMLGLLGGMSWESTQVYYKLLNQGVRERAGGLASASLLLRSFEFAEIADLQAAGDWDLLTKTLVEAANALEGAGAQGLMICTNTMHLMAPAIQAATSVPLIHIADATGDALKTKAVQKPLLLATRFTMEKDFYKAHIARSYGIDLITPDAVDRRLVHDIIYKELCQGLIKPESKSAYLDLIDRMTKSHGIDSVILGCTEIGLLIGQQDTGLPVFDTTAVHAQAGVDFMQSESP